MTKFKDHYEDKETFDSLHNHIIGSSTEDEKEKSLRYLLDFYVKHQFVPQTKAGLLTGEPRMNTYRLNMEFSQQRSRLRGDLKDMFE